MMVQGMQETSIEWILEHCSDAISDFKRGNIIYRGIDNDMDYFLQKERKSRRQAAYASSNLHTNIINRSAMFRGYPKREHIATTDLTKAKEYGTSYIMLPTNGSKVGVCSSSDVWFSFENMEDYSIASVNGFYRLFDNFLDINLGGGFYSFNTIAELKYCISELHRAYNISKSPNKDEELDQLLYNYLGYNPKSTRQSATRLLVDAMKTGDPKPIYKLFEKTDNWDLQTVGKLSLPKYREVWADGMIVMVRNDSDTDFYQDIFGGKL